MINKSNLNLRIKRKVMPPTSKNEDSGILLDLFLNKKNIGDVVLIHNKDQSSFLEGIDIRPEFRGNKYSNLLMQKVIDEIDIKNNIGFLTLQTEPSNVKKLTYIYQKYGFEPCHEIECSQNLCDQSFSRRQKIETNPMIYKDRQLKYCKNHP